MEAAELILGVCMCNEICHHSLDSMLTPHPSGDKISGENLFFFLLTEFLIPIIEAK